MIRTVRGWLTCLWATRRIQRRLDVDRSAPLPPAELARLESHLRVCAYCTGRFEHYRRLQDELRTWAAGRVDPDRVTRVQQQARAAVDHDRP